MKPNYLYLLKQSGLTIITIVLLLSFAPKVYSQVNTLYYMENVPSRSLLNPAFMPTQNFYIDLPLLSGISVGVGDNSFAAKDLIFQQGGNVVTPFSPNVDRNPFLNVLRPTTSLDMESRINLLGFGFRTKIGFFTFGLSERVITDVNIPKDLLSLLLKGAPDTVGVNHFNLKSLGMSMTAFTEAAFGYARRIDSQWTVGGKVKLLFGQAHGDASFTNLNLNISKQVAELDGSGTARITTPFNIPQNSDGTPDFSNVNSNGSSKFRPVGFGAGIDLGAEYKYLDDLSFSASLTDLGFIHWQKSSWEGTLKNQTTFTGMDFKVNGGSGSNDFGKDIGDSLKNAFVYSSNGAGYTTYLTAKFRLGAEYSLMKQISFGVLWENTVGGEESFSEVTTSVNLRPTNWFNASLSYGLLNGEFGTFGMGLNIIAGPIDLFLVSDYIPLYFTGDGIPYKSKYLNAQLGISLVFGRKKKYHRTD